MGSRVPGECGAGFWGYLDHCLFMDPSLGYRRQGWTDQGPSCQHPLGPGALEAHPDPSSSWRDPVWGSRLPSYLGKLLVRVAPSLMGTHGVLPPRPGGSWRPHLQDELRHRSWGDCCSCQGRCWVRTLQGPSCTLSLGTLSMGHSSGPRGSCPQAGCTPPPHRAPSL